jgi:hypothetical protein
VKSAGAAGSLRRMLVTFFLGSVWCAWSMIILPRAEAYGYLPASSINILLSLLLVGGPFVLSVYVVVVLSGSMSWKGHTIGEGRQSVERFWRHMLIFFLGAALTGLAVSVSRLLTSELLSTTCLGIGAVFLADVLVLVALWLYNVWRTSAEMSD